MPEGLRLTIRIGKSAAIRIKAFTAHKLDSNNKGVQFHLLNQWVNIYTVQAFYLDAGPA